MALRMDIITAFPALIEQALSFSIFARAARKGLVTLQVHDLRSYTHDKHRTIDDTPYGGGGGMLLKPEPIFECVEQVLNVPAITSGDHIRNHVGEDTEIILLSPQGETFSQKAAVALSLKTRLVMICGHYKGVDERVTDALVTRVLSIGDYVCSGGEYPALVVADAVARLIPGAIGDAQSALGDSFQEDELDCAYYTRPVEFRGMHVPPAMLSGHHAEIQKWRNERKQEKTRRLRPDLINPNHEKEEN